jgi:hypothetical protein
VLIPEAGTTYNHLVVSVLIPEAGTTYNHLVVRLARDRIPLAATFAVERTTEIPGVTTT